MSKKTKILIVTDSPVLSAGMAETTCSQAREPYAEPAPAKILGPDARFPMGVAFGRWCQILSGLAEPQV